MKRLSLMVSAALGLAAAVPAWGGPFLIFDQTASPDGRYAFAWGLPKKYVVNWDELRKGVGEPPAAPGDFTEEVENYLVDVKEDKILVKLIKAQAWSLPSGTQGNHRGLQVLWSPESDTALALYSLKWGYESFEAFRLVEGSAATPLDLGPAIEKSWRAALESRTGSRYRKRKDRLVVSFGDMRAQGAGIFSAVAYAEIPKSDAKEDEFLERRIRFSVSKAGESALSLKILGIQK